MKPDTEFRPSNSERPLHRVRGTVAIICPGGLEHGGGIGRQIGYFLQGRSEQDSNLSYRIFDSRGPWFLGDSRYKTVLSAFCFGACIFKLIGARLFAAPCVAHVNITGRGSTVRKAILLMIARIIAMPYLLHVHDYDYAADYQQRGPLMRAVVRRMFLRAKMTIVLGVGAQTALQNALQLPSTKIVVLHNAVPDPCPTLPRVQRGASCHFLFLGYLSARKGVPELLRALGTPALKSRDWRATLAGGGDIAKFRAIATDLGIADRVFFAGHVGEQSVQGFFAESDVLVLPSYAEGLAMSVLEGLAQGLAVVTTPVGAHEEVIEDAVSGLFIAPGNVDDTANALLRLIEDRDLRIRLQEGARQQFVQKFDVRLYAQKLSEIHATLLSEAD